MSDTKIYSARSVFDGMKGTLHRYLEAQYHIWDQGLIEGRSHLLETEGVTFQEPRIEATPAYSAGAAYAQLQIPAAARKVLELAAGRAETGIPERPYRHQADAIEAFLGRKEQVIVATGTGSGKTECFLMPILGSLAVESSDRPDSWARPGCRALLLYPMNALVNDQLSRLRRLLGQSEVADHLRGSRTGCATFGMYTSRTSYPGLTTPARDQSRLRPLIQRAYLDLPAEARKLLDSEGKWPRKDLEQFIASSFATGPNDAEMFSRSEMQRRCPDLLVTNYSMLEYMLLRPIERSLFEQTALWLDADKSNHFTVVLDEAHMYRGSAGAEVAYLLRRLHARLGIPRDRVRYILTSASLGRSDEASVRMKEFAANLSGLAPDSKQFVLIRGEQATKPNQRSATVQEAAALAEFDLSSLHEATTRPGPASAALNALFRAVGAQIAMSAADEGGLRQGVFDWLQSFGPAALTANLVTSHPKQLRALAPLVFPGAAQPGLALESMLALLSFARDRDTGRVFAPIRAHLFFRGLPGIYVCTNATCTEGEAASPAILGRMYSQPLLRCGCGARVYELLTHRDCGAAYVRGYVADQFGTFLWHEPSSGLWGNGGLVEAHFLVEVGRRATTSHGRMEGANVWLHKATGRLLPTQPDASEQKDYLTLLRPDGLVKVAGRDVLTFNRECPVCTREWRPGSTKIMDLATKGEAPFAQLVRTQVELQPANRARTERTPNAGRKTLLFSDGRQKAARLARDIPREIENDVFRQLLLMAAQQLRGLGREPTLGMPLYVAMLRVLAAHFLSLFDGTDRVHLLRDVQEHRKYYLGDLAAALSEPPSAVPARFNSLLLRHLGSPFYSASALTLAHLAPATRARRLIIEKLGGVGEQDIERLWVIWLQSFASKFAIDPDLPTGIRSQAAGYSIVAGLDKNGGLSARQQAFLRARFPDLERMFDVFAEAVCQTGSKASGLFLAPKHIALILASEDVHWYQCGQCATISPVEWWGCCPLCLASSVVPVRPGATEYLRARKAFFRDPVNDVLQGKVAPFNLAVEEHTAQLSYRDVEDASTTVEDFERRFRDILVSPSDMSIDVLSSTTTMEVGIDIGSLVAVALRNVPPLRQNYQQRAGRAGRRGSAVSTVVTYAQNSPHDSHYFMNPEPIIAGEPTLPSVDAANPKIIERHIRAQLIQAFFHSQVAGTATGDIFSVLGETMSFYNGSGPLSRIAFETWLAGPGAQASFAAILHWLPASYSRTPKDVAVEFVQELDQQRPASDQELDPAEDKLIEFLFSRGFLPSYAFPRDLCALQIERWDRTGNFTRPKIVQRPQQGLNVALSEYAPGRLVVVDKKTYRVGTVAANGSPTEVDRAARLFADRRYYAHCPTCEFSPGFRVTAPQDEQCPLCQSDVLSAAAVIVPQVVFPEEGAEVDEFDDEQVFTNATSAQLSMAAGSDALPFHTLAFRSQIAFARDQQLVMANRGEEQGGQYGGFLVCNLCGKWTSDPQQTGPHKRDYLVSRGGQGRCHGQFEAVYLGYGFQSDVLVVRVPMSRPLRFDPVQTTERMPIASALQSLAEAFVLGISQELDIDVREVSAGYRFVRQGDEHCADLFVYDTLSGGAGYATQAGGVFASVMTRAELLLSQCTCSTSCDKCLRHYANRFHHSILDRTLALDLLRYVRTDALPADPSLDAQRGALMPLRGMLQLAGWADAEARAGVPCRMARDGRTVELFSFPSLVHPSHYGFVPRPNRFAFSPFELSRDLPGAFGVCS